METHAVQLFIEERVAAVERSFAGKTGGVALCQLQKSGRMTGGLKYDEGQLYALLAAKRLARARDARDLRVGVEALVADWGGHLAASQQQEHPPVQWVAYYQGGVDALSTVLAGMTASP